MDFIMGKYGVLKRYEGDDTVIEVPKNVKTTIGDNAFRVCCEEPDEYSLAVRLIS